MDHAGGRERGCLWNVPRWRGIWFEALTSLLTLQPGSGSQPGGGVRATLDANHSDSFWAPLCAWLYENQCCCRGNRAGKAFQKEHLVIFFNPLQLEIGTLLLNCSCHGYCHGFVTAAISGLLSPCLSSGLLGAFVVYLHKKQWETSTALFATFCAFVRSIDLNPHHFLLGSIVH